MQLLVALGEAPAAYLGRQRLGVSRIALLPRLGLIYSACTCARKVAWAPRYLMSQPPNGSWQVHIWSSLCS
jgi:hypothetical protein